MACDPEAVTAFGDPESLAQQVAADEQPRRIRVLAVVLVGTLAGLPAPLYGIPENTLPPAPPEGLPAAVEWKLDWAIALYLAALVLCGRRGRCLVDSAASCEMAGAARRRSNGRERGTQLCRRRRVAGRAETWPSSRLSRLPPALVCLAALATARLASAAWQHPQSI